MDAPVFIVVDLFCGAGGTTTGFSMTEGKAQVIACVNHDHLAIESHWANHPEVLHFEEDITKLYGFVFSGILFKSPEMKRLVKLVELYQAFYPEALLILWASLECTNFSRAKGGLPRDADSRTLADHLLMYIDAIDPDYVEIENVVEFMEWGPMRQKVKNGIPQFVKNKSGEIVPAMEPIPERKGEDFKRWNIEVCKMGYFTEWAQLNSADFGAYTSRNRLFGCFYKPGLPVKWPEATHTKITKAPSLFDNALQPWKPVREVLDFTDEGESIFNRKKELCHNTLDVIYKGIKKAIDEGEEEFLFKYYGNGDNLNSINKPAGALTCKDRFAKVKLSYIFRDYKTGYTHSVNQPIGALPTVPKAHLLSFIFNPSHRGHTTGTNKPCPTIVASQHKAPLSLIQVLMAEHGIVDVKKRMLRVDELLKIQGFPPGYILNGSKTHQKKFIGNSVVPHVVRSWALSMCEAIDQNKTTELRA